MHRGPARWRPRLHLIRQHRRCAPVILTKIRADGGLGTTFTRPSITRRLTQVHHRRIRRPEAVPLSPSPAASAVLLLPKLLQAPFAGTGGDWLTPHARSVGIAG